VCGGDKLHLHVRTCMGSPWGYKVNYLVCERCGFLNRLPNACVAKRWRIEKLRCMNCTHRSLVIDMNIVKIARKDAWKKNASY
jgi:hypothetical protein